MPKGPAVAGGSWYSVMQSRTQVGRFPSTSRSCASTACGVRAARTNRLAARKLKTTAVASCRASFGFATLIGTSDRARLAASQRAPRVGSWVLVGHAVPPAVLSVRTALQHGRSDGTLISWDVATGTDMRRFRAAQSTPPAAVWSVAFSPDGRTVVSSGGYVGENGLITGGEVILWDRRRATNAGASRAPPTASTGPCLRPTARTSSWASDPTPCRKCRA